MKTLILYASKHGATKAIAQLLKKDTTDIMNIQEFSANLEPYDCIILGSCVYVGMLDKQIKSFLEQHKAILLQKNLLLFTSGLSADDESVQKVFQENISEDLLTHIRYKANLGACVNFPEMNFFEKTIIKTINKKAHLFEPSKTKENIDLIDYKAIEAFKLNYQDNDS